MRGKEHRLKRSKNTETELLTIINKAPIIMVLVDDTARIRRMNVFAETYTGKRHDEIVGRLIGEVFDCDFYSRHCDNDKPACPGCVLRDTIKKTFETGEEFHRLLSELEIGGEKRYWLASTGTIEAADEELVLVYAEDVTSAKQAEQVILDSLKEKEILLREVHHRVKNNLSIINSLVSLQIQYADSGDQMSFLKSLQNRVYSIAALHEHLYLHDDLTSINADEYIRAIINKVLTAFPSGPYVHIDYSIAPLTLSVNESLPVGIIINELVTNAVQHSGVEGENLLISVQFYRESGNAVLMVTNTGCSFPENIDFNNPRSLGFLLIKGMVEQLKGKLEIDRADSTRFKITFALTASSDIIDT